MGFTAVKTVAVGDPWSAKDMNRYVKDNFSVGIPDMFQAKGDLGLGSTSQTIVRLPVGTNTHLLTVDHTKTSGMKWSAEPTVDLITTKGDLLVGSAADTLIRRGVGSNYQALWAASGSTGGLKYYQTLYSLATAKGQIFGASAADTMSPTGISGYSDGLVLMANSGLTNGLGWGYQVNAGYGTNYATCSSTGGITQLPISTENIDTHGACSTAYQFGAKTAGYYFFVGTVSFLRVSGTIVGDDYIELHLVKSGGGGQMWNLPVAGTSTSQRPGYDIACLVQLDYNETFTIGARPLTFYTTSWRGYLHNVAVTFVGA